MTVISGSSGGLTIASQKTTWTASCSSELAVCLPESHRFARRRHCTAKTGRAQTVVLRLAVSGSDAVKEGWVRVTAHQLQFLFLGSPVLVAPVDADVVHPGQDPCHPGLAVLALVLHFLPENVSFRPQAVLLPDSNNKIINFFFFCM